MIYITSILNDRYIACAILVRKTMIVQNPIFHVNFEFRFEY